MIYKHVVQYEIMSASFCTRFSGTGYQIRGLLNPKFAGTESDILKRSLLYYF